MPKPIMIQEINLDVLREHFKKQIVSPSLSKAQQELAISCMEIAILEAEIQQLEDTLKTKTN